jgi:hypothetical protein
VDDEFVPRTPGEIDALVRAALLDGAGLDRLSSGLRAVSDALNHGDYAKAQINALFLRLPDLDRDGAARIATAHDILLKFNPNVELEPRDWHGRWTSDGGFAAPEPKTDLLTDVAYNGHYHDQVVRWLADQLRAVGSTVQTEITLVLIDGKVTAVADLIVRPFFSQMYIIEVKTGKDPYLSEPQSIIYAGAMIGNHVFSPSPRIRSFSFAPFEPLPPMEVYVAYATPGKELDVERLPR